MTQKKSSNVYTLKKHRMKKKNRVDKIYNIFALLIIFIAVALFFSGGSFGGFLKVFLCEIVITGIALFTALKSATKSKRRVKNYTSPKTKKVTEKSWNTSKRSNTIRRGKRNFNWVVEARAQTQTKVNVNTDRTETIQNGEANKNTDAASVRDEEKKFVPYRSPFDPIVVTKKGGNEQHDDAEQHSNTNIEDVHEDIEENIEDKKEGIEEVRAVKPEDEDIGVNNQESRAFDEDEQTMPEIPDNSPFIMMEMAEDNDFCDECGQEGEFFDNQTEDSLKKENEYKNQEAAQDIVQEPDKPKQEKVFTLPPVELLNEPEDRDLKETSVAELEDSAKKLVDTLTSFGVGAKVINISRGPSVTRFEIQPDAGVKVSKIVGLTDDIALNLAATGVRIEAPIPGKAAVGIEVPNKVVEPVLLREVLESPEFINQKSGIAFALGKDVAGKTVVADIAKMPHLLIAGATGSGKSVCINTLIISILYKYLPTEVKLIMIDPKVVELSVYNGIPHLLIPVVTDPKKAAGALNWAVQEMTNRYRLFAENSVRDIKGYNFLLKERGQDGILPQVVIIIDELADLMMVAPGEVEDSICRLAQMARAAGMHLVIATQRPSVDVITGLIKANIPSRIAFAVSSQVDSRTILDMAGAEKLLGRGDMLFSPVGEQKPIRVQGAFISDREVEAVVSHVKAGMEVEYDEEVLSKIDKSAELDQPEQSDEDELLPQAIDLVMEMGQASTSLIQRKLKVGYARAARILDQMEEQGIVGPPEGSKPRKVLVTKQ